MNIAMEAMSSHDPIGALNPGSLPELMEIKDEEALEYVSHLMTQLIAIHDRATAGEDSNHRRPSYDTKLEETPEIIKQLAPVHDLVTLRQPSSEKLPGLDGHKAEEMYKRFWLKEAPPISVSNYLKRFQRYCKSSAATYLTAGSLIYHVSVDRELIPVTRRNVYRLFCAAFIVSAKFVEDSLYSMSRYATTAGLKKADLARLELSFLLLIDFNINVDRETLKDALKKWANLNS